MTGPQPGASSSVLKMNSRRGAGSKDRVLTPQVLPSAAPHVIAQNASPAGNDRSRRAPVADQHGGIGKLESVLVRSAYQTLPL
jgi:hypothetical protein